MLAITSADWPAAVVVAFIAILIALWHAHRWSVKRLVMVCVYYKDGTRKDFITFPWNIEELYIALAGNPRFADCYKYDVLVNCAVTRITLSRFKNDLWRYSIDHHYHFDRETVLWDRKHALLVNVLRDFGLEDNQPLPPRMLSIASNQRLNEPTMRSVLEKPANAHLLTDTEVAYLERLGDCLRLTIAKKWERSNRLNCFSGKLPGTEELVMELLATDEGAKKVLACINRDWQPEPAPPPPPEPSIQTRTGGHC